MWRRAYLFLVLVRLYFAFSPSYLHPDENFQGPEVIAGTYTRSATASEEEIHFENECAVEIGFLEWDALSQLRRALSSYLLRIC